jgi:hypothetical protein
MLVIVLGLAIFAGGLRFFRLGAWPFGNDETATFGEGDALFRPQQVESEPEDPEHKHADQLKRLAYIIPVGYVIDQGGLVVFGRGEFRSRVLMALLGTIIVVLVFLALLGPLGTMPALASALLVALWPEHLFHSQNHRFYITAALFSAVAMLFGAQALQRRSIGFTVLACVAALLAIGTHTLQCVILAGLFVGILGGAVLGRQPIPWRPLAIILATGTAALLFVVLFLLPQLKGWNEGELWGYSPLRSLLGAVSQLGWPVVVLAVLGAFCLVKDNPAQGAYWLTFAGTWAGASLVFPLVITHALPYVFPQALSVVVLAGYFVAVVFAALQVRSRLAAYLWLLVACSLNLLQVASYYQDGNRYDLRAAAQYLDGQWEKGDRVAAVSSGILAHYSSVADRAIGLDGSRPIPRLDREKQVPRRLWIVLTTNRSGYADAPDNNVRQWLDDNCRHKFRARKVRFDYYDYCVDVFLYDPPRKSSVASGH